MKQLKTPALLAAGLLTILGVTAQPKKPNTPTPPKLMVATNMAQYRATPAGILRQQLYSKTFGDAKGEANKDIKYPDGSALHLTMVKKPSFADKPTSIKASVKKDQVKKTPDGKGGEWSCVTNHVQLTATSTTFLNNDYSTAASHIYPGACYTYDNFFNGYKEEAGERNPLTIVTNNANIKGSPSRTIDNPNMATIRAALDELFHEATGPSTTESFTYQIYETSNSADESLKVSGGASGWGVSFKGSYGTASQKTSRNITIDAIKTLFSITTVPPEKGFFKNQKIESKPNMMVIGSVSYGVRVLANLTVNFNSEEEAAAFSASYSGWGVSANVDLAQMSSSKSVDRTINCYVVGGAGNTSLSFDKKDLKKELSEIMSKVTYKNAMPVRYQLYDMACDVIGSKSATDEFSVQECTPGKDDPRLVNAYVTLRTGDDGKDKGTRYQLFLYPGETKINTKSFPDKAVFQFFSGKNSPEIQEKSKITDKLLPSKIPLKLSDFNKHGGALALVEFGDGDWNITSIELSLEFEDGTIKSQAIGSAMLTEDARYVTLYFDGGLKPR